MIDDQHPPEPLIDDQPVPNPEPPPEEWEDEAVDPDAKDRPAPKDNANPDEYAGTLEARVHIPLYGSVSA